MRAFLVSSLAAGGILAASAARSEPAVSCSELTGRLEASDTALKRCLELGLGECEDEQAARDAIAADVARCESGEDAPAADATPVPVETASESVPSPEPTPAATPSPLLGRKVGVLVEGATGSEEEAIHAGARLGLAGATYVDPGSLRAARAFLGASLDEDALARLRTDVGADRLVVVQLKKEGTARFLAVKVFDPGAATQRFATSTPETLGDEVRRVLAALPPIAEAATVAAAATPPVPQSSPPPSTWTPAPTWTPAQPQDEPAFVARGTYFDLNVFAGMKALSAEDWEPLASQTEIGFLGTVGGSTWPVLLATDFYYSFASGEVDGIALSAMTTEVCSGLRLVIPRESLRLHAAAGVVYASVSTTARLDGGAEIAQGFGTGVWAGGGVFLRLGRSANLGAQLRYSSARADIPLYGTAQAAGGLHLGMTFGFGFGAASSGSGSGQVRDPAEYD